MRKNEPGRRRHLFGGILRDAKRRALGRRLAHLRITVGFAEAVEIEAPNVEAGLAQRIAPGFPIDAVRNRQSRRERRTVHIEHGATRPEGRLRGREKAQEQGQSCTGTGNAKMFLTRVELGANRKIHHANSSIARNAIARLSGLNLRCCGPFIEVTSTEIEVTSTPGHQSSAYCVRSRFSKSGSAW